MNFCQNVPVSGGYHHQQPEQVVGACTASIDDLFSAQNMEVDVGLEWLSVFLEDCFSSSGNCLQLSTTPTPTTNFKISCPEQNNSKPQEHKHQNNLPYTHNFVVPVKARSKRKRIPGTKLRTSLRSWSSADPPLLHQSQWLADSELITPIEEKTERKKGVNSEVEEGAERTIVGRKCSHCQAQKTPQWRAGPMGPKTLCNACGVRYKSGRLFPEYRPAKSPTFVSFLHSNSHKKVLEMRLAMN